MTDQRMYGIRDAATAYSVSESTIRRAIKATDPESFPPPLRAKRKGKGEKAEVVIHAEWLDAWVESWPEAG